MVPAADLGEGDFANFKMFERDNLKALLDFSGLSPERDSWLKSGKLSAVVRLFAPAGAS
jgi:hypothetical protein